jgi:hypothetical protein
MEFYNGLDENVSLNNKTLIFIASWMGILSEITDKIDKKNENNSTLLIDIDKYPKLTAIFEINLLPTVIILDNDVESSRHVGYIPFSE